MSRLTCSGVQHLAAVARDYLEEGFRKVVEADPGAVIFAGDAACARSYPGAVRYSAVRWAQLQRPPLNAFISRLAGPVPSI